MCRKRDSIQNTQKGVGRGREGKSLLRNVSWGFEDKKKTIFRIPLKTRLFSSYLGTFKALLGGKGNDTQQDYITPASIPCMCDSGFMILAKSEWNVSTA